MHGAARLPGSFRCARNVFGARNVLRRRPLTTAVCTAPATVPVPGRCRWALRDSQAMLCMCGGAAMVSFVHAFWGTATGFCLFGLGYAAVLTIPYRQIALQAADEKAYGAWYTLYAPSAALACTRSAHLPHVHRATMCSRVVNMPSSACLQGTRRAARCSAPRPRAS